MTKAIDIGNTDNQDAPPTQADFIEALRQGDEKKAARILRQLDRLDRDALVDISDMLDPVDFEPRNLVAAFHPYRLALLRWKRGKPLRTLDERAQETELALKVSRLVRQGKARKEAIWEVAQAESRRESAVQAAYRRLRRRPLSRNEG